MKAKLILSTLFALISITSYSQDYVLEENGNISFSKIIESSNKLSQANLFSIAEAYFSYNYNDGKAVIQSKDKEKGTIIGRGIYGNVHRLVNSMIGRQTIYDVDHIIRIDCKDNKVRVIITVKQYKETEGNWLNIQDGQRVMNVSISKEYPVMSSKKENKLSREEKKYNIIFKQLVNRINGQFLEIEKSINEGNSKLENEDW